MRYPSSQYALRMLEEGAAAYVAKDHPAEVLLQAVRRAARGQVYLSAVDATAAQFSEHDARRPPHASLSAREHQVFTLLFQGRSVTDIAAELNLSLSTVSTHLRRVKDKLGAQTIGEIVSYAHRAGLTE